MVIRIINLCTLKKTISEFSQNDIEIISLSELKEKVENISSLEKDEFEKSEQFLEKVNNEKKKTKRQIDHLFVLLLAWKIIGIDLKDQKWSGSIVYSLSIRSFRPLWCCQPSLPSDWHWVRSKFLAYRWAFLPGCWVLCLRWKSVFSEIGTRFWGLARPG